MKKAILLLSFCLGALVASAQKTILLPSIGYSNTRTINIEKVILSDTATQIVFKSTLPPNRWFRISSDSYIRSDNEKLVSKSISGIAFNKNIYNTNGSKNFTITFPPLKATAKSLWYFESDHHNSIKIVDVYLIPPDSGKLPANLLGKWFANKKHVLGISNSTITYKDQIWNYNIIIKKPTYFLRLRKGQKVEHIVLEDNKDYLSLVPQESKTSSKLIKNPGKIRTPDS